MSVCPAVPALCTGSRTGSRCGINSSELTRSPLFKGGIALLGSAWLSLKSHLAAFKCCLCSAGVGGCYTAGLFQSDCSCK